MSARLEKALESEKEWRIYLMSEVSEIKKDQKKMISEMTSLKTRVATVSSVISLVVTVTITALIKYMR
jgi:hypothetical protein